MAAYLEWTVNGIGKALQWVIPTAVALESRRFNRSYILIDAKSKLPVNFDKVRVTALYGSGIFKTIGEYSTSGGNLKFKYSSLQFAHDLQLDFFREIRSDERLGCCNGEIYRKVSSIVLKNLNSTFIPVESENDSLASLRGETKPPYRASVEYMKSLFIDTIGPDAVKNFKINYLNWVTSIEGLINYFGFQTNFELTPEESINLSLNGMANLTPKINSYDEYVFEVLWKKEYLIPGLNAPDIRDVRLVAKKSNDQLKFVRLEIKEKDKNCWDVYGPSSSVMLKAALRLYNASVSVYGAMGPHLADTHLVAERIVLCMEKSLQAECWFDLFGAQMREVKDINDFGSATIFGPKGIVAMSLNHSQLLHALEERIDKAKWTWKPRQPISKDDLAAMDDNDVIEMIEGVVHDFTEEYMDAIVHHWPEWHLFSQHLCSMFKSFDPLTQTDFPQIEDIERFKQFCTYFIFITTFGHTRIHYAQEWLKNPNVCPLSPHNGGYGTFGSMTLDEARRQLLVVDVLTKFKWDNIEDDKFEDVNPLLREGFMRLKPTLRSFKGKVAANINI